MLAAALVEAAVLPAGAGDGPPTADAATVAALAGTLAYADLVDRDPALAAAGTPATLARNQDLLALLNSVPGADAVPTARGLAAAPDGDDVLPGLHQDPASFADHIRSGSRANGREASRAAVVASPVLADALARAGVPLRATDARAPTGRDTLAALDARLDALLPAASVLRLAEALALGVAA